MVRAQTGISAGALLEARVLGSVPCPAGTSAARAGGVDAPAHPKREACRGEKLNLICNRPEP